MFSSVINGEYKGFGIKTTFTGKVVAQRWSKKVFLDDSTIKSYEIVDKAAGKRSLAKTVGLGAVFGVAGAVVGASSKKEGKTTVKIMWKDGKKSLIEFDPTTFKAFLKVCPL